MTSENITFDNGNNNNGNSVSSRVIVTTAKVQMMKITAQLKD